MVRMDKLFKDLAALLGESDAEEVMEQLTPLIDGLREKVQTIDAARIANGEPTIAEQAERDMAEIRQMVADGEIPLEEVDWLDLDGPPN